jgi:Elongation factor SelB, winged helix.
VKKTKNNILYTSEIIEKAKIKLKTYFKNFHSKNYLKNTVSFETINSFVNWCPDFLEIVLSALITERSLKKLEEGYCLSSFSEKSLTKTQAKQIKAVEAFIEKSGLLPVNNSDIQKFLNYNSQDLQGLIYLLNNEKKIAGIGNDFFIHQKHLRTILNDLKKYFGESKEINVSDFKKLTGLTRKTAIPLLEFLDKNNYTIRKNNYRIIGRELHE